MSVSALILLAFAMATDAFAAAIARGAGMQNLRLGEAVKTALLFGIIEAITPLVGWLAGTAAKSFIDGWDHWLAFTLLVLLGGKMIYEGLKGGDEDDDDAPKKSQNLMATVGTAFATSIDSMAVGVGLAFLDINIYVTAATIGCATALMVFIGLHLGRGLGKRIGNKAEILGGLVLILIGASILAEHVFKL
ncbi:manganese efflux pump MntP [Neisseria perflava]|uniref:manganese efflux pump MntP n=1 Tax=Neisseria perflava TaxID=33053 RepID=UPI00209E3F54|nr:manganese efflux pump MntP family protein [Neisseria perflava]MCP1660108.1 putative Mn2+ efflux pump MntP [Neisseria perflava]MCP1772758.1 putative Mn2+ efflux pump MntP [Neisseria perflava]